MLENLKLYCIRKINPNHVATILYLHVCTFNLVCHINMCLNTALAKLLC